MKDKKQVMIAIIILLIIFLPLTLIGIIFKGDKNLLDENPSHELSYKGYLWFYDENDDFLSKYECQTEKCLLSNPTIDDAAYQINYYKDGNIKTVPVVDGQYTFITDGAVINLYNVTNGTVLQKYKTLKSYNATIENNTYILQNMDGLWGALTIGNNLSAVLPFEYDFIGLINKLNADNKLVSDKFIVYKDSKWMIVNNKNEVLTKELDTPIIDYTSDYVITKDNQDIKIYGYENFEYLQDIKIKDYVFIDEYIGIVTEQFVIVYKHLGEQPLGSVTITNQNGEVTINKNQNKIEVKIDDTLIDSIEIK